MTIAVLTTDFENKAPTEQAEIALGKLENALMELSARTLISSPFTNSADTEVLQRTVDVARQNVLILREGFRQMQGVGWDKDILPIHWFANGEDGWQWWKDLFDDTYDNVTNALGYSAKVTWWGRFGKIPAVVKKTADELPDSTDYRLTLGVLVILAVAVIVWKLA